jgi:hypothetical protein
MATRREFLQSAGALGVLAALPRGVLADTEVVVPKFAAREKK